jgi:NAD(P)H-flavin reductase
MSALSIDLENRDRVKIAGRMAVGVVAGEDAVGELQMLLKVEETLGNCPKYMNKKVIRAHLPEPKLVSDTLPLSNEALNLIGKADMFFLSSLYGEAMDTNHRGGPAGFVRVVKNEHGEGGVVLAYPEYSGNRLYETLGNLYLNPKIGVVIPDFETSDVLYLTGTTEILIGTDAAALLPHTKLAIKISVTAAKFVKDGLPFGGTSGQMSPYNPPIRPLATELTSAGVADKSDTIATATLTARASITPSINRYGFTLSPSPNSPLEVWKAGQYITLDFAPELDMGWSHMRPEDPQSLNDDFVRTFTISSPPPTDLRYGAEFEITARTHGPATRFLSRHNIRVPLELPVVGFGGEDEARISLHGEDELAVFIAAGVGITPLLAQAGALIGGKSLQDLRLRVLWSLRAVDMPLAVDVLDKLAGLAQLVNLYVTGNIGEPERETLARIKASGVSVEARRMRRDDVTGGGRRKYHLCVGTELQRLLMKWLDGREVVTESFNY